MDLEQLLAALQGLDEAGRRKVLESLGSGEVNQILSKIRSEEKNKLQKDLEKRDNKIKELEKSLNEIKSAPSNSSDIDKILEQSKAREQELAKQIQDLSFSFTNALKEQELKTARAEVLAKYNGEIIPELITGNSPSEIEQAAQAAHLKYVEMQNKFEAQFKEKFKVNEQQTTTQQQEGQQSVTPTGQPSTETGQQTAAQGALASVLTPEQLKILQDAQALLQSNQAKPALGVPAPGQPAQPAAGQQVDAVQQAIQSMQQTQQANARPSMIDLQSSMRQGSLPGFQQQQPNATQAGAPVVNPANQAQTTQSGDLMSVLQQAGDLTQFAANRTSIMQAAKTLLNSNK